MAFWIKLILHIIIIIFLTIITQIGGVIYIIAALSINRNVKSKRTKRTLIFVGLYLIATLLIVPRIAPLFGRVKIEENGLVKAHTFVTRLANRNYVTPQLKQIIQDVAIDFEKKHTTIQIVYLDANFPFFDGFPLLPHLSHNDGKKVDIAFIYKNERGVSINAKPSKSGYGIYVSPIPSTENHNEICKNKGFWQYDFSKYLAFGVSRKNLSLSMDATRDLILEFLSHPEVKKIFLEPHLKKRLKLNTNKVRFQGCHSVRHDDHFHLQL